ncbi:hypothetical protein TrCOL_g2906 [Triparma columacea]|uniref:Clu domain-containing protein n=1 Tax=Triparma columacea TaxID=722753 RepID=A0A9W7G7X0_9STRA|nr:hypothetical protein TrCOL_g2906 [Triparma columacea]
MGVGVSALGNGKDQDEKLLDEKMIEEALGFYRTWSMSEVKYMMNNLKSHADLKKLAELQAYDAAQNPTNHINNVHPETMRQAFSSRVAWAEFYELVYKADEYRLAQSEEKLREAWHPSTSKYAMVKDPDAESELEDFLLGDTIRPGRENHDDGAYTSDEESEIDDEEESSKGSISEGEEDESLEKDENNPQAGEANSEESEDEEQSKDFSDEDSAPETPRSENSDSLANTIETPTIEPSTVVEDEDDGENPPAGADNANPDELPPPPTDAQLDDDAASVASSTHSHEIIPNHIPASFDPSLRSPVFFGYYFHTVEDVNREGKDASEEKSQIEADTVKRKIEQKKQDLAEYIEKSAELKKSRANKLEKLKKRHAAEKIRRSGEYLAMEKTMDPDQYAQLKRQFDVDEQAASTVADKELQDLTEHNESMDVEMATKRRNMEQGLRDSIENESNLLPAGAKLERTSRIDMKECVDELDAASVALDTAQKELDVYQEDAKGSDNDLSLRKNLIHAETAVEARERDVEKCLNKLDEQELLLQRALRRKAKENLVLPLYSPLASSMSESDFSVSLLDIIVALTVVCKDKVTEKLRFLVSLFDINDDQFLAMEELKGLTFCAVKVLDAVGYSDRKVDDEEVQSIVLRAFYQMNTDNRKGMTHFETRQWCLATISQNKFLTTLFGADWKYGEMSTFQRQVMNPNRQYEIGLISMPDLKYHAAKNMLQYKPALDPIQKANIHERALAMGQDDPMKPDYSKFLPKKRRRVTSNVEPLEHGHLTNLSDYRNATMLRCAKKLQNAYRGKLARKRAEDLAKKEAFYAARDIATEEMKKKVAAKFKERENQSGVAKMKWDANIRKKQITLRAAGKHLDRDGVIGLLMDDAIRSGTEEISARFHELAVKRGFEEAREEEKKDDESLLTQLTSLAAVKKVNVFKAIFKREELVIPTGDIVTPRAEEPEKQIEQVANTQVASLTAVRRAAMIRGVFPPDLYKIGEMFDETLLRFELGCPDPLPANLLERLRAFDKVMTLLKTEDLLLELPSKRLLLKYVVSPHWKDDMQIYKDFEKHFRVIRNSKQVVDTIRDVAKTDLEIGVVQNTYSQIVEIPDYLLQTLVATKIQDGLKESSDRLEKLSRSSDFKELDSTAKVSLALERDDLDLNKRTALLAATSKTMIKLEKKLHQTQVMLDEAVRKRENMVRLGKKFKLEPIAEVIQPSHRLNWMERFWQAKAAPETTKEQSLSKYYELSALAHDFLTTATKTAMMIIDEMSFPVHEKSVKPVEEREVDGRAAEGGRGDRGLRHKYEANGIRFKIHTDDHGLFNGSDEAAAKAAGNDVMCSLEFAKCHVEGVVVPFEATIDYSGFRVLAVAKLPISKTEFNEAGDIRRVRTEQVMGTSDRGLSVHNRNRYLDNKMAIFAKELNLARHFVKGENDMNACELYSSVDIRGFKGQGNQFYLLNFWRGMPSENPDFTPHLPSVSRGNSIFYRLLRPEFVRTNPSPLSSNANTRITEDAKDWIKQLDDNELATNRLINDVIPALAEELCKKELNESAEDGYGLDLAADFHRCGVNLRHMGLVRTRFWRKLRGNCSMIFHSRKVESNRDFKCQVNRGDQVKIFDVLYRISKDTKDDFTDRVIYLDKTYEDDSKNFVDVFAGEVSDDHNSQKVRDVILAEMVARTMKNLLRLYLRHAAMKMKISVANIQTTLMTEFMNIITGSNVHSDEFWSEQLYMGIINRFGSCALSESERKTYRIDQKHMIVFIIRRFTEMFGIQLTNDAISLLYATPDMFRFVPQDINKPGPKMKHNIADVEFSDAVLLSNQADISRSFDYQNLIVRDKPFVYWKFAERRGSRIAHNYGSGGHHYAGFFSSRCEFELKGAVVNDDLNRSILFEASKRSKVDTKYARELCPTDVLAPFSIEGWAMCTGNKGTNRTILMTGRASLVASREETWCFIIYEEGVEIVIDGPEVDYDEFHHVVGTYDGCLASLYIDSVLVRQMELRPEVTMRIKAVQEERAEALKDLNAREKVVREKAKELSDEQSSKFLITKEGRNLMRQNAIKLVEHSEFKMKMDKKAAEKGITKLSKKDAQALAIKEYKQELYMKNVQSASEEYRKLREELDDQNVKDDEYARELLSKAMCVGSAVSSRSSKDGSKFFEGHLCHIAAYVHCLSADNVRVHYNSASQSRGPQADRLYTLAAEKFGRALKLAPDDPIVLEKYAENLCNYLNFDVADTTGDRKSMRKVSKAIKEFTKYHNTDGLAEILRRLPADPTYAELACDAYTNILYFNPNYFQFDSFFTLKELSTVPFKFSLHEIGSETTKISIAADMFRKVVGELSLATVYGEENLKWIQRVDSDAAVVSIVTKSQTDADPRIVDLTTYHDCSDLSDDDLAAIADNHRLALVLNVSGCSEITDKSLIAAARCCSSLQSLNIDKCDQVTGKALDGLKNFTPNLRMLSAAQCKFIDDEYLIPMLPFTKQLCVLNLNNCDLVTDLFLTVVGKQLRYLELLHMAFCTSVTDEGLYQFAVTVNTSTFTSLDITCCRSITDDGLVGLAEKCTAMKFLNICGVNKCTSIGAKAITHNCLDLEYLNFEDLDLVTDEAFHFDSIGDGRRAVDQRMLSKVVDLNLSECARLTDHAVAGVSQRCVKLEILNLSGCSLLTDEACQYIIREPRTGGARGEKLKKLRLAYCMNLTDRCLDHLSKRCTKLDFVDLTGCVHFTDDGIRKLVSHCKGIQSLTLARCKRLTDKALCNLADYLWVEELDISGNTKITDDGIDVISMEFAGLIKLNISGCEKITDRGIVSLGLHCRNLLELQAVNLKQVSKEVFASTKGDLKKCKIKTAMEDIMPDEMAKAKKEKMAR